MDISYGEELRNLLTAEANSENLTEKPHFKLLKNQGLIYQAYFEKKVTVFERSPILQVY